MNLTLCGWSGRFKKGLETYKSIQYSRGTSTEWTTYQQTLKKQLYIKVFKVTVK